MLSLSRYLLWLLAANSYHLWLKYEISFPQLIYNFEKCEFYFYDCIHTTYLTNESRFFFLVFQAVKGRTCNKTGWFGIIQK